MKGAPVAKQIITKAAESAAALREEDIVPTLAIVQLGDRPDDASYVNGAIRQCMAAGVYHKMIHIGSDIDQGLFLRDLQDLAEDEQIHGILLLRPLPPLLEESAAQKIIPTGKDVDGMTEGSLAGVYAGTNTGFAPCTAQAVMEMLRYYDIPLAGKRVAILGRSLVIGRPLAMLMMAQDATVTLCHRKTLDIPAITRQADIIVAAAGQMGLVGAQHLSAEQVVIDVGIHYDERTQKMCGDVRYEEAEPIVAAITPVPGGVGAVTSAVLAAHVVEAARQQQMGGR